ncbi:MAG: DUF4136 domain-containing protein [Ekhidna sp.]|nr:DUF4136 domain-containing protein [Ekhidna sp.]
MKNWFILLLLLGGCSQKIVSYVNPKASFGSFETYRLVSAKAESKNVSPENTMVFDLIRENINRQMDIRSYKLSNVAPDLTLRYEITSSTRVENNNAADPRFFNPGFNTNTRTIYESVILLELMDQKRKLVWQGSYDLKQQKKEKKASKAIEKAIGYTFTTYPYKALSKDVQENLKELTTQKTKE